MRLSPYRLPGLDRVQCLDCSKEYAKPAGGGTLWTNPGCPGCGYLGWLPISVSLNVLSRHDRFAADRLQRPLAPTG